MNNIVVVTGSATGIGKEVAKRFLSEGDTVHGIDVLGATISDVHYIHHLADVADATALPEIPDVNILINNAGVQDSGRDINVNLSGTINTTRKYGLQPNIHAILNQCDAAAHTGAEFDEYVASKGGILAYTKWTAKEVAKYGAVCNSISFGGIHGDLNAQVEMNAELWSAIMEQTPLKRWCTVDEAVDWIYMFTVLNHSCSGQDLIIDNLESLNNKFIW